MEGIDITKIPRNFRVDINLPPKNWNAKIDKDIYFPIDFTNEQIEEHTNLYIDDHFWRKGESGYEKSMKEKNRRSDNMRKLRQR